MPTIWLITYEIYWTKIQWYGLILYHHHLPPIPIGPLGVYSWNLREKVEKRNVKEKEKSRWTEVGPSITWPYQPNVRTSWSDQHDQTAIKALACLERFSSWARCRRKKPSTFITVIYISDLKLLCFPKVRFQGKGASWLVDYKARTHD